MISDSIIANKLFASLLFIILAVPFSQKAFAEDVFPPELYELEFPKELANKLFENQFKKRLFIPYDRNVNKRLSVSDDARLAWRRSDTIDKTSVKGVKLFFESDATRGGGRKQYSLEIEYGEYQLIAKHSNPAGKESAFGVRLRYNQEFSTPYGGYLYGNQVPGFLIIVARTKPELVPPMLICPRYGASNKGQLKLIRRDPKTKLVDIQAKVDGKVSTHFLSGYGIGTVELEFSPRFAPYGVEKKLFTVTVDPRAELEYQATDLFQSVDSTGANLLADGAVPAGITNLYTLYNSAGYVKGVASSQVTWIAPRAFPDKGKVQISVGRQARDVTIGAGLCFQTLPMEHYRVFHGSPDGE